MTRNESSKQKAHQALEAGNVPDRPPDVIWGGQGVGAECIVCRVSIGFHEVELEFEYASGNGAGKYHVHPSCLAAWELEEGNGEPSLTTALGIRERAATAVRDRQRSATNRVATASSLLPEGSDRETIAARDGKADKSGAA